MNSNEKRSEEFPKIEEKDEQQIYIAIQKYLSLMMIEFKEHTGKYKLFYDNVRYNVNCLDVCEYERVF